MEARGLTADGGDAVNGWRAWCYDIRIEIVRPYGADAI